MSIFTLILKDMKIVVSDKKALLILIGMPIILFSILSFALAGTFSSTDDDVWTIKVGIAKEYDLNVEKGIINDILSQANQGSLEFDAESLENILFNILDSDDLDFIEYEVMSLEEAKEKLKSDDLGSIVILPENYVSDIFINMSPQSRKQIDIKIIKNPNKTTSSAVVENLISEISNRQSQMMISNKVSNETLKYYNVDQTVIDQYSKEMMSFSEEDGIKIEISDFKIEKLKTVNSSQYYSVAMLTMFLLFGASYGAKFMLEERKNITLQRQQMAGIGSIKVVIGKMVVIFLIAIMQITLMIITSHFGFGVYWGNPISVLLVTLVTAFGVTGLGAILSAVSLKINSLKAINMFESGIFQIVALFGGSYFPIYLMPKWFNSVSKLILNGAALDAYNKVMMDSPIEAILPSLLSIIINGVVFFIIGMIIVGKQSKNRDIDSTRKEVIV